MSLTYVTQANLGILTPISAAAGVALAGAIVVDLQALADLVTNLNIDPPDLTANLQGVIDAIAGLTGAINLGLPSIDFQATAVADAIAELTAILAIPFAFDLLLGGGAGIYCYAYGGTPDGLGPAVSSALDTSWPDGTSATADANAIILGTVSPSVWDTILKFFGAVSPKLPPGLSFVGQQNIGTLCPFVVDATGSVIAELGARLQGLIALALSFNITPPSFSVSLDLALKLKASIEAALTITLPDITFQLQAILRIIADLTVKLQLLAELAITLAGPAGVFIYRYSGPGAGLGPALSSALSTGWPDGSGTGQQSNALILGTVTPSVWATMSVFFAGAI